MLSVSVTVGSFFPKAQNNAFAVGRSAGVWRLALLLVLVSGAACAYGRDDPALEAWLEAEVEIAKTRLLDNCSPQDVARGCIVASPSRVHPAYYKHWVRDAAIAADALVGLRNRSTSAAEGQRVEALVDMYVAFSRSNQVTPNPSGGLGEPLFNPDGSAFTAPWGRPQNDGPALRALTLTGYAWQLLPQREEYVRRTLYDGKLPTQSLVKADLEYVAAHWADTCFDPWEEVKGHHFYTRTLIHRALIAGADLATHLGDPKAAEYYRGTAGLVAATLEVHVAGGAAAVIRETLDRDGGLDYKASNLDAAVIVAAVRADGDYGATHPVDENEVYSVCSRAVHATAKQIRDVFAKLYPVNWPASQRPSAPAFGADGKDEDEPQQGGMSMPMAPGKQPRGWLEREGRWECSGSVGGVVIGRYAEDRYDGYETGRQGNGWFLLTLAFAELYYRTAHRCTNSSHPALPPTTAASHPPPSPSSSLDRAVRWSSSSSPSSLLLGDALPERCEGVEAAQVGGCLVCEGDGYMEAVRRHAGLDGRLSEQINRESGFKQGAPDLTWSYAALLTARWQRDLAVAHVQPAAPQ